MAAYMAVHEKIQNENIKAVRWYHKDALPEVPVPLLGGPDLVDLRQIDEISSTARQHKMAQAGGAGSLAGDPVDEATSEPATGAPPNLTSAG